MKQRNKALLVTVPLFFFLSACSYDMVEVKYSEEDYLKETYPNKKLSILGVNGNELFVDKGYKYLIKDEDTSTYFTVNAIEGKPETNKPFSDNFLVRENVTIESGVVNTLIAPLLKGVYYLVADIRVYDKTNITQDASGNITSKGDISTSQAITAEQITDNKHQIEGGTVHLIVSQTLTNDHAQTILDTLRTNYGDIALKVYTYNSDTQVEYVRHLHAKEGVALSESASKNVRVSSDMYYYDGKGKNLIFTHVKGVK